MAYTAHTFSPKGLDLCFRFVESGCELLLYCIDVANISRSEIITVCGKCMWVSFMAKIGTVVIISISFSHSLSLAMEDMGDFGVFFFVCQ